MAGPGDLVDVDLGLVQRELEKGRKIRGRVDGQGLHPLFRHATEIEQGALAERAPHHRLGGRFRFELVVVERDTAPSGCFQRPDPWILQEEQFDRTPPRR